MQSSHYTVAALYCFTPFEDPAAIREPLLAICEEAGTRGTLLLAHEGINGTIAGSGNAIDAVIDHIRSIPGCEGTDVKFSYASEAPFHRMKVRLKREIVTMGEPGVDPRESVGRYVPPQDWNDLISDPDTIVIDTRNDYEVAVGTFEGAVDPETTSFREFPKWFRDNREELLEGKKRVAMFCTGGIRCEKSTSFLRGEGVEDVYHLKGGILKYLETVPEEESKWHGDCFVFDERVTVRHGLEEGDYHLCRACRRPITDEDMAHNHYAEGVSCPYCYDEKSEAQRARYAERQRQRELEKERAAKAK
ncbi:rhodanese-related sulfurtransferase [uncultured Erythrobacter sp.]|uniref:oxygen-dependent tRNA uridine(34) hydroxylase TrhO n=1 Tax=uncultured Erythrobacter sp. TaxID=263913 RepID=UPI0026180D66|nr:rhodanese-related sulfurtransferase [uncultured Erythrobacter sp.]